MPEALGYVYLRSFAMILMLAIYLISLLLLHSRSSWNSEKSATYENVQVGELLQAIVSGVQYFIKIRWKTHQHRLRDLQWDRSLGHVCDRQLRTPGD